MPNLNLITARAEKTEELSDQDIREALKLQYPDYRIAELNDLGATWEAVLEKPLDKISNLIRTSEFPLEKEEIKEDVEEEDEGEEKLEVKDEEESEESDDEGDEFEKKPEPKKDINSLLKEILHAVKALEEKAGLIDEIHEKIKPHAEQQEVEEAPSFDEMGPTGPGGGNPAGLSGGMPGSGDMGEMPKRPPVPRRPYVPSGKPDRRVRNPAQRGQPSAFGSTKIAFSPKVQNKTEFSFEETIKAMEEKFPGYKVVGIQEDTENNRYVGKLRRQ